VKLLLIIKGGCCRTVRKLLQSMSVKQGMKYDAPESVADIAPFIAFHKLKVDEILEPLSSFSGS
jgi:phosphatidylserine decarboxylase